MSTTKRAERAPRRRAQHRRPVRVAALKSRGFFQEVEHPEAGTLTYPGPQFRMSEVEWTAGRAPLLGEHNAELFCEEMGMSREDLLRLRAAGPCRCQVSGVSIGVRCQVTALLIRSYEARDMDAVWALHREGLQQTTPEYPEVLPHYEADLRDLEAHYLSPGSNFWVQKWTAPRRDDRHRANRRRDGPPATHARHDE
jgi:hypothetical protein